MVPAVVSLHFLVLLVSVSEASRPGNIIPNPSFDDNLTGWREDNCDLVLRTNDSAGLGNNCGLVTNRLKPRGPKVRASNVEANSLYDVRGYVKMLTQTQVYFRVKINAIVRDSGVQTNTQISLDKFIMHEDGWAEIGGEVKTGDNPEWIDIQVLLMDNTDDFLVDDVTMVKYWPDPNWKTRAIARIDNIRKGNITVMSSLGSVDPSSVILRVQQTNRSFPFGSAVDDTFLSSGDKADKMRAYFYEKFNWAVHTYNTKWKYMEPSEGGNSFSRVDALLNEVIPHGVKPRGHCIAWDKDDKIQDWVKQYSGDTLKEKVIARITEFLQKYNGTFPNYDVMNENDHYRWFEENMEDPNWSMEMFELVHELDPAAQLFLNDYNIFSNGLFLYAYKRHALKYLDRKVPVHVLGVQGHLEEIVPIDVFSMRLNTLAEVGLPIWLTEFDVDILDVTERANYLEDLLTLLYSHKSIEGFMFWGFWDGMALLGTKKGSLCDGDDFVENEAGARVGELFNSRWWTDEQVSLTQAQQTNNVRAFHGTYAVSLLQGDTVLAQETVQLEPGQDIQVNLNA